MFKNPALENAISKAVALMPPLPKRLDQASEYIELKQLYTMAKDSVNRCAGAEFSAQQAKLSAMRMEAELKVRLEILEIKLGLRDEHGPIEFNNETEEHA